MEQIKIFTAFDLRTLQAKVNRWSAEMKLDAGLLFKVKDVKTSYNDEKGEYVSTVRYRIPNWLI